MTHFSVKPATRLLQMPVVTILAVLFFCFAPSVAIAEYTVATVDVNRILNESPSAAEKRNKLNSLSEQKKELVAKRQAELKEMETKLQKKGVSPDSPEADTFRQEAKDYSRLVKDSEEEVRREFLRVNKELTDMAMKLIENYAEKNNIDLVLDKSSDARGPVLFNDPKTDITEAIIREMKG